MAGQHILTRSYWVSNKAATFRIDTDNDIVVYTAPYGRFLLGKTIEEVMERYDVRELK